MREMKDSGVEWIGEIPKNWKVERLRYIIKDYKSGPFGSALKMDGLLPDGNILIYSPEHITLHSADSDKNLYLPDEREEEMSQFIVKENDILFPIVGSLGKAMIITADMPKGIINQRVAKFQIDNTIVDQDYFMWLFAKSNFYQPYIDLSCRGSFIVNLTKAIINDMPCVIQPLAIQKKLSTYLDIKCSKIDEIIEKQQAIIEKLKEYKLSIITEAVTKGLNPDVEMKDSGNTWFGYIPAHWDCVISRFVFEKVSDINHFMPESIDSGYPYLMIGDLKEHISDIDFENCKKISKMDFDCLKQKMKSQKGDVIFARYATIGTVCYVDIDIDFLVSYACVTVRPNKELYGEYLYYYFKSCAFRENVKQFINSNTQENVGIEALCKTKITIPPYKEQKMIVNYLNEKSKNIDISIEKKRNIVEKLQEYKKSLIYEVVTGKKEV